ncbi:unnamed protein product [Camellia sinensis]
MDPSLLDDIINRLLEVRGKPGKQVQLSESEMKQLCVVSRDIFLQQPNLLELEAPIKICGYANYLFFGDYVDRGKQSLETICLLLAYKITYPENFFLLRGNHECASINRIYGFYDECKRRFNVRLWKIFTDCFNCLPVAALIDEKILCMHGGLSPDLHHLDEIRNLHRPTDVPDYGLLCDLLWYDPSRDVQGWGMNDRGVSYTFDIYDDFSIAKVQKSGRKKHKVRWMSKRAMAIPQVIIELQDQALRECTLRCLSTFLLELSCYSMMLLDGHQRSIIQTISSPLVGRSQVVERLQVQRMLIHYNLALFGMKHLAIIMMLLLDSIMMEIQLS